MMRKVILIAGLLTMFFLPSESQAFILLDTGAPGVGLPAWNLQSGFQTGVAGAFDINEPLTLNSIEGWFRNTDNGSGLPFNGSVTLSVYGSTKDFANGDIPDITQKLYSQLFNVTPGVGANWYGASNLDWQLNSPGKYFAAFEIEPGNTYRGFLPFSAPTGINGATRQSNGPDYLSVVNIGIGLRVNASPDSPNPSPVPEPATIMLLGSGLGGAIRLRKKDSRVKS